MNILTGREEREGELDAALSEIWMQYQGSVREEEMTMLLDEVRGRAIAAEDSLKLEVMHGSAIPSIEELDELTRLLDG